MTGKVKVVLGLSQEEFYNFKLFESVSNGEQDGIKLFKANGVEYIGVEVTQNEKGLVTLQAMEEADKTYCEKSFGRMLLVQPKFYTLEV